MKLQSNYNKLVIKVEQYLRKRREAGKWEKHLPAAIFDAHLWLWEKRSMRIGAAWGAAWALAPVPMQSCFTLLCCIASRGNVAIGVLACWVSVPGYQIIAWPLQWVLGAWFLKNIFGASSGASMQLVQEAAHAAPQGWQAVQDCLNQINMGLFVGEFLLGCALSCGLIALFFYLLVGLIVKDETTDETTDEQQQENETKQ